MAAHPTATVALPVHVAVGGTGGQVPVLNQPFGQALQLASFTVFSASLPVVWCCPALHAAVLAAHAVTELVPVLNWPFAQAVQLVSSAPFSLLSPAVKNWPEGQEVVLAVHEVAGLLPSVQCSPAPVSLLNRPFGHAVHTWSCGGDKEGAWRAGFWRWSRRIGRQGRTHNAECEL